MMTINEIIRKNIDFRDRQGIKTTLLAVCPNSDSVLAAGVKAAASMDSIMLFAATLNQVDLDGGYTGWTPETFVQKMNEYSKKFACRGGLYPCLDHGGPWLKDKDTASNLSFESTFLNVKASIEACVKAGYSLLHIDPTVDRALPPGTDISIETVVDRSVALIAFAEQIRKRFGLPDISYEVGTEEVHGGMVDLDQLRKFISMLKIKMNENNLSSAWPAFCVAQVGTDLHTTRFDPEASAKIFDILAPYGSLAKGHYSDWVENPGDYPESGMGGANVGPEFTAREYQALKELASMEGSLIDSDSSLKPSRFIDELTDAVVNSGRWKKWLLEGEKGKDIHELSEERQDWLIQTGCRYVWTNLRVLEARKTLYRNVSGLVQDPEEFVVDKIVQSIQRYISVFNLKNSRALYS